MFPFQAGPVPMPVSVPSEATQVSIVPSMHLKFLTVSVSERSEAELGDGRRERLKLSTRERRRTD